MTTMPTTARLAAAFALLLALLVTGQPAAAQQPDESILTEFQVFTCPVGYAGDDYLADCAPAGPGDYAITVTDTSPTEPTATTETAAGGAIQFATFPGATSYDLTGADDATTYYACFDGTGTFLFDGTGRRIETTLADGDALSCRWYITPAEGSEVADETGSTVTIQVLTCPDYYDGSAYRDDCTPGLNDASDGHLIDATANDVVNGSNVIDGTPDDQGVTTLIDVAPGSYFLGVGVFRQYWEVYLSCFDITSGDEVFLFDEILTVATLFATPPNNLITVEVGRDYSCRYYVIPGGTSPDRPDIPASSGPQPSTVGDSVDATVGVQIFDCPEGYAGDTYLDDCAPTDRPVGVTLNDGIDFVEATVIRDETGDDGRAGFVELQRGQYHLTIEDLSPTTTIYHTCFDVSDGSERYVGDGEHNRIRFFLDPSDDLLCRIYLTANGPEPPAAGTPGSVTLSVLFCAEGYDGPDWSVACTSPSDGMDAYLLGGDLDEPSETAGHEIFEGVAVFRDVPAGGYAVTTSIPGHGTIQRGACVPGSGPVPDDIVGNDRDTSITVHDDEGATCVIYVTPISFRA